jgi:hypothetical protein
MSLRSLRQNPLKPLALASLLAGTVFVPNLVAQERRSPAAQAAQPPAATPVEQLRAPRAQRIDAETTRQALMQVLAKHPPSVGRVLKADSSLMRNETYLSAYPELRDFLAEHPEVPQNAGYYLETVHFYGDTSRPPATRREELMDSFLSAILGFAAAGVSLGTLVWLIRTTLTQRRWNRLSKIQAEVHTKLMDRFSSNDELLTYIQTPSGRRFLESGPSPLQEEAPAIAAPFSKILWSLQVGAVLLVTGLGFLFLSGRAIEEARDFFYIAGCMSASLGAGFGVSAAAAYFLSRRLGLIDRPAQNNA